MTPARHNNTDNTDDLEGGLSAASPPSSPNRSSDSLRNDHVQTATTTDHPGAAPELAAANAAAAATAPAAVTATSNVLTGSELVDDASGLPLPIGMMEEGLAEDGSASAAKGAKRPPSIFEAAAPPFGLESVNDDDGPPLPIGMHELESHDEGKKRGAVEIIDDDEGPGAPLASLELTDTTDLVNDLSAPTPFNSSKLEDIDADAKKKASIPSDVDSIIVPTREDIEDDDQPLTMTSRGDRGLPSSRNNNQPHQYVEERNNNAPCVDEEEGGNNADANARPALEQDQSTPVIPEAFLVEERSDDGIVIQGEPLLPFWKQRRARLLLIAFIALLLILAVSLGVPLSLKRTDAVPVPLVLRTNAPSQSNAPSVAPSSSPTKLSSNKPSDTPSYSPSACVNQISSNAKKIDLQIDDPQNPIAAVDGKDMVVVARQGGWMGPVFVIFYTLANGEWQRRNTFQEDGFGGQSSVALSGSTAFVGFEYANDGAGAVSIYEKDQYGVWNLMKDPFIHDVHTRHDEFGQHVDIDGDLACVGGSGGTYLYHQENNKWVQFDRIEWRCYIAGDTIMTRGGNSDLQLYRYNQQSRGVFPIQDPIPRGSIWSLDLSNDYLVYWNSDEEDAFMYRREDTNQTYTFHQQLNISGPKYNFGLALDNDILVVRGIDKTHIFSEQINGKWEESITLDQKYDYYALSGRSLIATTASWDDDDHEVYYFDIEGCSQAMPTQTPSLSTSPTDLPSSSPTSSPPTTGPTISSSPSMSPSPTVAPSSSSSPTETCEWIQVAITYDWDPWETYWELWRVVGDGGDNELVKSHYNSFGDTSYVESLCLQEGEYIFTITDVGRNGICCDYGEGNYNVTSNGTVKGGEFGYWEETTFSIPFIPLS